MNLLKGDFMNIIYDSINVDRRQADGKNAERQFVK